MPDEPVRRPGYYIAKPGGSMDASVMNKPMSAECVEEFKTITSVVYEVQAILRMYEVMELSHKELKQALPTICDMFASMPSSRLGGLPVATDAQVLAMHKVMSFLAAIRSFLDHTNSHLMGRFGDKSVEHKTFTKRTNDLYDSHFSYRFVDQLRNMSQHVTLPISIVNLKMERVDGADTLSYSVDFTLERDRLLSDWKKWKAAVRRELEAQPDRFDLLPILEDEMKWMADLFRCFIGIYQVRLDACAEYLQTLLHIINAPPGAVPVLWVGENLAPGIPPGRSEIPPFEDVRRIIEIINRTA